MASVLHKQISEAVRDGIALDEIEDTIIELAPVDEDQKAALWLYAQVLSERHRDRGGFSLARR